MKYHKLLVDFVGMASHTKGRGHVSVCMLLGSTQRIEMME